MSRKIPHLTNPVARQLAHLVTFESLSFGPKDQRIASWAAASKIALNCQSEQEFNRWWRSVMPDAAYKSVTEFRLFVDWKIADIQGPL